MVLASDTTGSLYETSTGRGWDGVVKVAAGGYYGSGVLLYSGAAILTAAHVLHEANGLLAGTATVHFETASGQYSYASDDFVVHPLYDAANSNYDLAIIRLTETAVSDADRYQIFRGSSELGARATLVGYGASGSGAEGYEEFSGGQRHQAVNRIDVLAQSLNDAYGQSLSWSPEDEGIFIADFDNGLSANDAIGQILGHWDGGEGGAEGMIAPGDSGSPAFVNSQVAGIASYIASFSAAGISPDIDNTVNSSFGEMGFWQRIRTEQQWVDRSIRSNFKDVPQTPEEVRKEVVEGDDGTSIVYFMLEFHGVRDTPEQILSVDYATRDGSARSGEDYIAAAGTLNLYPGETQAVLPVEVIGDVFLEGDEIFYLDVFNPQGGSFGNDVEILSASRTILDDDAWV